MAGGRGYWKLQLCGACAIGAGLLGFLCLGSWLLWAREIQERCSGDNCVIDERGWLEAHPAPAALLALFPACAATLLVAPLVERRRVG